jgi:hypothetical protein
MLKYEIFALVPLYFSGNDDSFLISSQDVGNWVGG